MPAVEHMAPGRSPRNVSVRYFNDDDRRRAEDVSAIVARLYGLPAVTPTQIRLVAPRGQLEIWLPQASAATASAPPPG